jgi:hypothetical protein
MSLELLKHYVNETKNDQKNSHGYRARAAFVMLEHVDLMIDRYESELQSEKGAILLDVFGVLQGLFVAIDALYDLAIGLTQYKYHINVNSNPTLHELKFIRNDIVGHPTHRTYPNGGMGFSILSTEHLSKERFSYHTYIFEKNNLEIKTKDVYIKPLFDAYHVEKDIILNDLYKFLTHEAGTTSIPEDIYVFYETLNLEALKEIKQAFLEVYGLDEKSSNRFIWRIGLLETLINWDVHENSLKEMILYMSKVQASKLYDIALDLEHRTGKDLYTPIPEMLLSFFKFIRKNEKIALPLLNNLHDYAHPLFKSDVLALMALNPSKEASQLLHFIKEQTDENKVYLIGSMLRSYRPKNPR